MEKKSKGKKVRRLGKKKGMKGGKKKERKCEKLKIKLG